MCIIWISLTWQSCRTPLQSARGSQRRCSLRASWWPNCYPEAAAACTLCSPAGRRPWTPCKSSTSSNWSSPPNTSEGPSQFHRAFRPGLRNPASWTSSRLRNSALNDSRSVVRMIATLFTVSVWNLSHLWCSGDLYLYPSITVVAHLAAKYLQCMNGHDFYWRVAGHDYSTPKHWF